MSYNLRNRTVKKESIKPKAVRKPVESFSDDEDDEETLSQKSNVSDDDDESVTFDSDDNESITFDSDEDEDELDSSMVDKIASRMRNRAEEILNDYLDDEGDYNGYLESPYLLGEWKGDVKDLDSENEKKIENELGELIQEMRSELPTVKDIIESDMTRSDKKECIYYLDVMKNSDPHDPSFHDMRTFLISKTKKKTKKQLELERLFKSEKSFQERIIELNASDHIKTILLHYAENIGSHNDNEQHNKKVKMEGFLQLPYNNVAIPLMEKVKPDEFLINASDALDKELFGMEQVKRKFLSVLSKRIQSSKNKDEKTKGCAICLNGPPGVGKTHISRIFAKCLGLPFHQITIGGAKDSSILLGSDNSWVGASCGQIAHSLQKMGCSNGVLFIDEIDKVGSSHGTEIYDTLNHVIDFTSNSEFEDVFFREIKLDLSQMWFVLSMNDKSILPKYVLDRLLVIDVEPYTSAEKLIIARDYMIPRFDLADGVTFSDESIRSIIDMSSEHGVREISNIIEHICQKISMHVLMENVKEGFKHCEIKNFKRPYIISSFNVHMLTRDMHHKEKIPFGMYN